MYAVMEVNGTQVRVEKDDKIVINRLSGNEAKTIKVDKVLFGKKGSSYFIGEPYVKDAYVECEVLGDKRGKKLIVFKYRDRKSSQSKKGHRQEQTELKIIDMHFPEVAAKKTEEKAEKKT